MHTGAIDADSGATGCAELLARGRVSRACRTFLDALPAPALGRPAAARRDRDGVRLPARDHRARRADDRSRRDDPAQGAGDRRAVVRALRRRRGLRQSRPRGRGRARGPVAVHVRRPDRRDRRRRPSVFGAPRAPVHARPAARRAVADGPRSWSASTATPPRPGARPAGCSFAPRCPLAVDECRSGRARRWPSSRPRTRPAASASHEVTRGGPPSRTRPHPTPTVG